MPRDERTPGGRPRDADLDARVLAAAIAVLGDRGLQRTRIDAIAAEAGVPKSTIYRRWPGLSALILDAMAAAVGHGPEPVPSGDPEADLRALALSVGGLLAGRDGLTLLQIGVQLMDDPELSAAYRSRLVDTNRELAVGLVEHGRATGRFRSGTEARLLVDQAIGAIVYRRLILRDDITETELAVMIDDLIGRLVG